MVRRKEDTELKKLKASDLERESEQDLRALFNSLHYYHPEFKDYVLQILS